MYGVMGWIVVLLAGTTLQAQQVTLDIQDAAPGLPGQTATVTIGMINSAEIFNLSIDINYDSTPDILDLSGALDINGETGPVVVTGHVVGSTVTVTEPGGIDNQFTISVIRSFGTQKCFETHDTEFTLATITFTVSATATRDDLVDVVILTGTDPVKPDLKELTGDLSRSLDDGSLAVIEALVAVDDDTETAVEETAKDFTPVANDTAYHTTTGVALAQPITATPTSAAITDVGFDADVSGVLETSRTNEIGVTEQGNTVTFFGNTVTYTPALNFFGIDKFDYVISRVGEDLTTYTDMGRVTVTVANVNDAPTFTSTEVTAVDEDAVYTYNVVATDVDADALTITAPTLPTWLGFTDNGGGSATLTATPDNDAVGNHDVVLVVDDGQGRASDTQPFTITVTNTNDAPTIANVILDQNGTEDTFFTFTTAANTFADVDTSDTMTLSAAAASRAALPAWLGFTDNGDGTATFSGTPSVDADAVTTTIELTATDGAAASVTDTFDIAIAVRNDPPQINAPGLSVDVTSIVNTADNTTDISVEGVNDTNITDEETVFATLTKSYQWKISKDGAAATNIAQASGTLATLTGADRAVAAAGFAVYYSVKCELSVQDDGTGGTAAAETTVYGDAGDENNLLSQIGNTPPVITVTNTPLDNDGGDADLDINEGETITIDISVEDGGIPDDDGIASVVWSTWNSVDNAWTQVADNNVVTGGGSTTDSYTFTSTKDHQLHAESTTWKIKVVATDGLTPTGVAKEQTWDVTITDVNNLPTISGTPDTQVLQDADYTFTPTSDDQDLEDQGNLVFSINTQPAWADFNTATGALTSKNGRPTNSDVGTYQNLIISVVDTDPAATLVPLAAFDIQVVNVNDDPVAGADAAGTNENTPVDIDVVTNDTDIDITDHVAAANVDNDELSVTAVTQPTKGTAAIKQGRANTEVTFNPNGDFEDLDAGDTEDATFDYTVSDGNGGTNDATVTVTVTGVNDAPAVVVVKVKPTDANESLSKPGDATWPLTQIDALTHTITDVDGDDFPSGVADGNDSVTYVWDLVRDGTAYDAITAATPGLLTEAEVNTKVGNGDGFLKGDKFTVTVTADDGAAQHALQKTVTLGNPSWFPEIAFAMVANAEHYRVVITDITGATVVTIYLKDQEVQPVDYLRGTWANAPEVLGLLPSANNGDYVATVSAYVGGLYEGARAQEVINIPAVEYDEPTADETDRGGAPDDADDDPAWTQEDADNLANVNFGDDTYIALEDPEVELDNHGAFFVRTSQTFLFYGSVDEAAGYYVVIERIKDAQGTAVSEVKRQDDLVLFSADDEGTVPVDADVLIKDSQNMVLPGVYVVQLIPVTPEYPDGAPKGRVVDAVAALWRVDVTQALLDEAEEIQQAAASPPTIPPTPELQPGFPLATFDQDGDGTPDVAAVQTVPQGATKVGFTLLWGEFTGASEYYVRVLDYTGSIVAGLRNIKVTGGRQLDVMLGPGSYQWQVAAGNEYGLTAFTALDLAWFAIDTADNAAQEEIDNAIALQPNPATLGDPLATFAWTGDNSAIATMTINVTWAPKDGDILTDALQVFVRDWTNRRTLLNAKLTTQDGGDDFDATRGGDQELIIGLEGQGVDAVATIPSGVRLAVQVRPLNGDIAGQWTEAKKVMTPGTGGVVAAPEIEWETQDHASRTFAVDNMTGDLIKVAAILMDGLGRLIGEEYSATITSTEDDQGVTLPEHFALPDYGSGSRLFYGYQYVVISVIRGGAESAPVEDLSIIKKAKWEDEYFYVPLSK